MDAQITVPFDRNVIEAIVEDARAKLVTDHPAAASPRFPFGMHHAGTRRQVRVPSSRRHLQRSEIAEKLIEWASMHGGAQVYAWQSVATAVSELVAGGRVTAAARDILTEAEAALQSVPPFLPWLKKTVTAAKPPRTRRAKTGRSAAARRTEAR